MDEQERARLALLSILEDEKLARSQLEESQRRYMTLVEGMAEGLMQVDNEDNIVFINQRLCRMTGYDREELVGRRGKFLFPKEEDRSLIEEKNKSRLKGISDSYVVTLRRKDGELRQVQISGSPLYDSQGKVIGSIGVFTDITEQVQARHRQELLEKRYRQFVESTQDLAFLKDSHFRYMMVNEANRAFFGRPLEEILGRTDNELMPAEAARACRESDLKALATNSLVISEETVADRIYETRKFPVPLEDGSIGVGGLIRDVTEQKRYQEAIRESSSKWKTTFDSIGDGVALLSPDQQVRQCNRAFADFLGRHFREIIGRHCYELVHPGGKPAPDCPFAKMQASRQRASMEMQVNGRSFLVTVDPILNQDGSLTGAVHTLSEITEQKMMEQELAASEEKFRTFFENTFVGIYRTTPEGRILLANPALVRMLGYETFQKLAERNLEQEGYEPGYARDEFKRLMDKADQVIGHEAPWRRRDGKVIWVRENARCVRDAQGRAQYYEGTVEDITAQKRAEEEKKLMEEELLQSQKMEAIGHLAGGVAHDFNNMLAGILGNAEMLLGKLVQHPDLARHVEQIISGAEHAAHLTRQLLDFSRKEKTKQKSVDVNQAVSNVAEILSNTLDRKIKIEKHLRASQSTVLGDQKQLENALINFGLNSRDAMPHGGRLIFATESTVLDQEYLKHHRYNLTPGNYAKIEVTDTGCGMSPEVKARIFEPFFTTKEPGKGTGLGLASAYGAVKNHGGIIECYSEPGHGTTMKIYLPLYDVGQRGAAKEDGGQAGAEAIAPRIQGLIMVVDDEELVRAMTEQILKSQGYRVLSCDDPQEAVEIYKARHTEIKLVILDMIMPKMSGREVFIELKKVDPDVRAILSSGFSEEGEAREVLKLGIKGFVQKPFRVADLMKAFGKALE